MIKIRNPSFELFNIRSLTGGCLDYGSNAFFKMALLKSVVDIVIRYRWTLSAGTARASSEERHFLRGLETRAIPAGVATFASHNSTTQCISFESQQ